LVKPWLAPFNWPGPMGFDSHSQATFFAFPYLSFDWLFFYGFP